MRTGPPLSALVARLFICLEKLQQYRTGSFDLLRPFSEVPEQNIRKRVIKIWFKYRRGNIERLSSQPT